MSTAFKADLVRELRRLTGAIESTNKEFWAAPNFTSGVAKGIVVELSGNAKTEWLLALFKMHSEPFIFWCEKEIKANPTAFYQRGISLERIKFITYTGDLLPALRLALESQHYPFVVAPSYIDDIKTFQRFSLWAEKSKSTLFFLSDHKLSAAWPISLQLDINFSETGFEIDIVRQKHAKETKDEAGSEIGKAP